jgi:TRAP-type transport system periplasmic protein
MKKRHFFYPVLLISFLLLVGPFSANGATVWKMAHKMPPASPEGLAFQLFADEVERLSKGQMKIKMYPSEQLGGVGATLDMLRKGTIDIYCTSLSFTSKFVPEVSLSTLPFVFRDRNHWQKFINSESPKWKKMLIEKSGLSYLGNYGEFMRGPYRILISKRPILKLEDLKGLKLRMYKNEMVMNVWKALGAEVLHLPFSEVYQGLKTGLVESVTNNLTQTEPMKFQEVAKYFLRTNEFPQSVTGFVNHKKYQSLSKELKDVLNKGFDAGCALSQKLIPEAGEASIMRMVEKDNVTFIIAPMHEFRDRVMPLYKKWEAEGKFGLSKGTMDLIQGL